MRRSVIHILLLGVLCIPSIAFGQPKNRISIQTGLFHCFFDKSPILNTNYQNKAHKPFNGTLYNSVGLQYNRFINSKNAISINYMYYYEIYLNVHPNLIKNVVSERNYNTFNITYERIVQVNTVFQFTYGGGLNYRKGKDAVVVNYGYFFYADLWEPLVEVRSLADIGINVRFGIEYTPLSWLTLYSKFDLIGFVYLNDKKGIKEIQDYNYDNYPHRFDLSWQFGIGFNFGKRELKVKD